MAGITLGRPVIVGHRANSGRILLWFRRMGVTHVEVDVNFMGGRPVVMHGPPGTRRATPIGQAVQWIDYKLFYRDPLLRPSPLAEWLRVIMEKLGARGVLLDLKARIPPAMLRDELQRSGWTGDVYVSTNDHRQLPPLRNELPEARLIASYSVRPVRIVECTRPSRAHGIGVRIDLLDEETAREIKGAGLLLSTWTINTLEQARKAARLGADLIITDRPDIAAKALF